MTAVDSALTSPRRLNVSQLMLRHPELGAAAAVTASWAALLVITICSAHGWTAQAAMADMPMGGAAAQHSARLQAASGLPPWVLMTVAMMGPAALIAIRHTGLNSLHWRRQRAIVEFSVAYLAIWTAFGLLAQVADTFIPVTPGPGVLAGVLVAAAAWQLSPLKSRCLRGCHRSFPLPPRGWRADKGAFWFGLRNGLYCLGTCWCLMLVMIAAPGGQLLWTAGLTGIITAERLLPRPRGTTRVVAAMLGFATVATLSVGNLLQ
jgi:predicted metal-binding membrane protein